MENTIALAPDQIYSTTQAADLLGISDGTIRSRKSREKEQFVEGVHWVQQEGSTFWTCTGILELAKNTNNDTARTLLQSAGMLVPAIPATPAVADSVVPPVASPATESVAGEEGGAAQGISIDLGFLEPMLDATGRSLALEFYRRLPKHVLKHVQRMAKNPTDEERQVIQAAFQPVQRLQQEVEQRCVS